MKILSAVLLIILILVWAVIAVAAAVQTAGPSAPSWFEHVDLMSLLVWGLFLVVIWFLVRTLKKIDTNQATLFTKLDTLCEDFYTLRGEHNAIKARCDR